MKFAIILLHRNNARIYKSGKSDDLAVIGAALVFKAAKMLSKEKNISVETARDIILESIKETDINSVVNNYN